MYVTSAMSTLISTWGTGRSNCSMIDFTVSKFFWDVITIKELLSASATTYTCPARSVADCAPPADN